MNIQTRQNLLYIATLFLICALIILGGAWERYLAPVRPGGSLLSLKVLPLLPILWGMLRQKKRAFQWIVLLVWIYVAEGATRAWSDQPPSQYLAALELLLSLLLFASSTLWIRTHRILTTG